MISFKKLILTTDFSLNADAAVPYAVELAHQYGGRIFLLHVASIEMAYATLPTAELIALSANRQLERARDEDRALMQKAEQITEQYGVPVEPIFRLGDPVTEITKFAAEEHADAIIISTRGLKGFSHLVWGSVAERVVRQSPCAVLSVHPQLHEAREEQEARIRETVSATSID
jgi:universal stress protein A